MRIPRSIAGNLLPSLLSLAIAGPLVAQPSKSPADESPDPPHQPAILKGEAKVTSHSYTMQKGITYRIKVTADGFVPELWIQGQNNGAITNPSTSAAVNSSTSALTPAPARRPGNVTQRIFTPTETKAYQIKVDHAPYAEVNKGAHTYTLTIERAVFKPRLTVNDSQLDISESSRKLEQGKVYGITVTGSGFAPELQIFDGTRSVATAFHGRWFGFGPDAEFVTAVTFVPSRTMDYRIVVAVGPLTEGRKAPLGYTTQIVELKVELSVTDQLTKQDPVYPRRGGAHKLHTVKLEAGKNYQIDMMSRVFDAYLFLEDAAGNVLMEDDDGGEGFNARIIFRPAKTDTYRIVATTFNRGGTANASGPYTLTVTENAQAQPRFGARPAFRTFQK